MLQWDFVEDKYGEVVYPNGVNEIFSGNAFFIEIHSEWEKDENGKDVRYYNLINFWADKEHMKKCLASYAEDYKKKGVIFKMDYCPNAIAIGKELKKHGVSFEIKG